MSRHKIDAIKKYFLVCSLVLLGSNQIFKAYEAGCLSLNRLAQTWHRLCSTATLLSQELPAFFC